jgi:hypothetical protein
MSAIRTLRTTAHASDHFEPENSDPQAQRRIRGQLEQIDYMAFACNREVIAGTLKQISVENFQRLALATATARSRWAFRALEMTASAIPTPAQTAELTQLRTAYEELAEAYEALRRMVERGYLSYPQTTPPDGR